MKAPLKVASLKILALGLFLLVPFATAQAQAPSLSTIPSVTVNAGGTATVNIVAVDISGRPITLTSALPSFAILNTPTFGTGVVVTTLTLTPAAVNVGNYTAAVTATAGGVADIEIFQITVNAAGSNQAPVVTTPPLQEVTAGSNLSFTLSVNDPDGDDIEALFAPTLPAGATFTPNGTSTSGLFNWTPGPSAAGEYDVVFTAMAMNGLVGAAVTHIRVASAPTLMIAPIADVTIEGGSSISVPVIATGLPGALITLTAALPSFATLNPPGTGTGSVTTTISVAPPVGSAGTYHASVTATSLGVSFTEAFDIIVTGTGGPQNRAPVLSAPASQTVSVGSTLSFNVTATDADGDHVTLSGSALPPGSGFIDHLNNSGTFSWSPVSGQAGTYTASFTGLDGRGGSGSASTEITVTGGTVENHPPTLSAPLTQVVAEGANLAFTVTATDPDGDHVTLTANSVPAGATFADQGDNTLNFSWTPGSTQSGTYNVTFSGNDGNGGNGTASTAITVTDVVENHPPTLIAPLTQQVDEGTNLSFTVTATDTDGDHVALSGSVPSGATFTDQGDNTGHFSWTPSSTQSGVYDNVSFDASDGRGGTATASTIITVTDVVENHPPTLIAPLTQQVDEGANLTFTVTATDQDGDHVALSGSVPSGASFTDQGDNSGVFSWTPSSTQSGVYDNVAFDASDGRGGTATASTIITVNDVGGGGEVPGKACLIGSFQSRDGATCFRIRPVNGSFDLRDVVLSSITFVFHGASVPALNDGTRIELKCHGHDDGDCHHDDGDDHHGDGDHHDGDDDHGDGHHVAALNLTGDHHGDGDDGDDDDRGSCGGVVCGEHGGKDDDCDGHDGDDRHGDGDDGHGHHVAALNLNGGHPHGDGDCDTLGIRACFSTQALREVLAGAKMPCDLVHAEIHATLTSGATVVATFGKDRHQDDGDDDGDKDKDKGKDEDKDKDRDKGDKRHVGMNPKCSPNPLNPKTDLSFTLSREGRVRVTVYDMRGRLVKSLLDEYRAVGEQRLAWDGSNTHGQKVASGVYFFRIQAPEGEVIQRAAVVK